MQMTTPRLKTRNPENIKNDLRDAIRTREVCAENLAAETKGKEKLEKRKLWIAAHGTVLDLQQELEAASIEHSARRTSR